VVAVLVKLGTGPLRQNQPNLAVTLLPSQEKAQLKKMCYFMIDYLPKTISSSSISSKDVEVPRSDVAGNSAACVAALIRSWEI